MIDRRSFLGALAAVFAGLPVFRSHLRRENRQTCLCADRRKLCPKHPPHERWDLGVDHGSVDGDDTVIVAVRVDASGALHVKHIEHLQHGLTRGGSR